MRRQCMLILLALSLACIMSGCAKNTFLQITTSKKCDSPFQAMAFLQSAPIYSMGQSPLLINIVGKKRGQKRLKSYLQANVSLVLSNEEVAYEIDYKLDIIKAAIIDMLGAKSVEELSTANGKNCAANELKNKFNEFLQEGKVSAVLFTNYIIQAP